MCGILGHLGEKLDQNEKIKSLKSINHRGPDFNGDWQSHKSKLCWLGHTRLAIIDLSKESNQPFQDSTKNWTLVFNGEIYNFLELKKDLINKGVNFRTNSDTEVFLYGLIIEGLDFQLKCNGMWAFALWNESEETLFLGRDRFGIKPLYWSKFKHERFCFASEMKAIREINKNTPFIEDFIELCKNPFSYESTEKTIYKNIYRLKAGHNAIYKNNNLKIIRWWNTLDHLCDVPKTYDEQLEVWKEIFFDSVNLRMRADVKIGTALSGGLDSSSIISSMKHVFRSKEMKMISSDWQNGFCCSYPNSELDEKEWAEKVANSLNIPLNIININPFEVETSLKESLSFMEDPYLTLPLPMLSTYKRIRDSGIKVTLDGHGADELLLGYENILMGMSTLNFKNAYEIFNIYDDTFGNGKISKSDFLLKYLKSNIKSNSLFKKLSQFIKSNHTKYYPENKDRLHPNFLSMNPFNQALFEMFHYSILPTLLRNYDRYSMSSGVEVRMPFMDWRLVCYAFSLPMNAKIGNGFSKRILRDSVEGILTDEVRLRKKKVGWNAPINKWLKGPLSYLLEDRNIYNNLNKREKKLLDEFKLNDSPNFMEGHKIFCIINPYLYL